MAAPGQLIPMATLMSIFNLPDHSLQPGREACLFFFPKSITYSAWHEDHGNETQVGRIHEQTHPEGVRGLRDGHSTYTLSHANNTWWGQGRPEADHKP